MDETSRNMDGIWPVMTNPITVPNAAAMTKPALQANRPRLGGGG